MPRALFKSINLIGDGLYIQPALKRWVDEHPDWDIDLLTLDDHITCLYRGMGIPNLNIIFEKPDIQYDFEFEFKVNIAFDLGEKEHLHISQAYMKMLGYPVPEYPLKVDYTPPDGPSEKGLVLLSMFSASCASREGKPPNKMLSWAVWLPIIALARQLGKVAVFGGPKDRGTALGPIKEEEYYVGSSLEQVARWLRDAKLLISIDNGMGHLAATQGTPTILFYPVVLSTNWIVPSGNKRLFVYQMNPTELNVHGGTFIVRQGIKSLLGEQHEEQKEGSQESSPEVQSETGTQEESVGRGRAGETL